MKIFYLILIFISTNFFQCNENENEYDIAGYWVIEDALIKHKQFNWEFMDNSLILNSDSTCTIPFHESDFFNNEIRNGKWKFYQIGNNLFLEISSKNEFFGRKFQIIDYRKEDEVSYGFYQKMTLIDDTLELYCVKAVSK